MNNKTVLAINDLLAFKKLIIMGILNVTPDSFSDGGKYLNIEDALTHAKKLLNDGAEIIDIGGESTRPQADLISEEEELKRVIQVISELKKIVPDILISIDTYKSNVAKLALQEGAKIINDVSGMTMDPEMLNVAAKTKCRIIIVHNNGLPMIKPDLDNKNIVNDVVRWLEKQISFALAGGVKEENIIVDPGIGFSKTPNDDLNIIKNLQEIKSLGFPLLVGLSRKSFIKKLFGENNMSQKIRELIRLSIENGVTILRLHEPDIVRELL